MAMAGWGGRAPAKLASRVKTVKPAKKVVKTQRSLHSYCVAQSAQGSQSLSVLQSLNPDHDVDLEAVIDNKGMEWVDADTVESSNTSPSWS